MDFRKKIEKIQTLPDKHKKVILWIIVAILAAAMLLFWFNLAKKRVSDLGETIGKIELPRVETPIENAETEKEKIADWKTYKNEEYGFEIKYPKDWSVEDDTTNKKILILNKKELNYPVLSIQLLGENYQEVLTEEEKYFNEWIKFDKWQKNNLDQPKGEINDITFSKKSAKEFLSYSPIGAIDQTIIVPKNGSAIRINSFKNSVLDPILSTFKFLE